jgi:hypothetical protein
MCGPSTLGVLRDSEVSISVGDRYPPVSRDTHFPSIKTALRSNGLPGSGGAIQKRAHKD